jgi:hypothetical protein
MLHHIIPGISQTVSRQAGRDRQDKFERSALILRKIAH